MRIRLTLTLLCALCACTSSSATSSSSTGGTSASSTSSSSGGASGSGSSSSSSGTSGVGGAGIFTRFAGMWSGPATMTPLGDFPEMNFDMRPEGSGHELFGRVDLDDQNSLRFGYSIETVNGADAIVFRNGGLFSGMSRDTRTALVDFDEDGGRYHFCAELDGGCGYVDALFTFADATHLTMNVHVNGAQHVLWSPTRTETRDVPSPFPADLTSQGSGTADWPAMPELDVTVSWPQALAADADVWVLLSTTSCSLGGGGCTIARHMVAHAHAGDTSATMKLLQIHAGAYKGTAVLDRNNDFQSTFGPDHGDGVSAPNQAVTVPDSGVGTASFTIATTI